MRWSVACLSCLALGACVVADNASPDASGAPTVALFELPGASGAGASGEYYALPFPNDLRVRADGTLDLDAHPRPNVLIDQYLSTFSSHFEGFGTNSGIFVRFSAGIDVSTLPASAEAARADDASVYLVDVDAASPERGLRRPLRFRFEAAEGQTIGADWLAVLPYPGFTLRPRTTYALVVTTRLHGADGSAVQRSADFEALLAGAAEAHALAVYAPLTTWLDEAGGDERADVVSAAVFTTQDPTALMGRLREVVHASVAAPTLAEVQPAGGDATLSIFTGSLQVPIFQRGESPYQTEGGDIVTDAEGVPQVQRMETVRVAFTFPPGPVPASGWPVVLYAHGTGGDFESFIDDGTAARFAARGLAVMGADQVLNGARLGGGSPDLLFYNFQNPLAGRDNSRQGAADNFQLTRLIARVAIPEGGRTHRLDPARAYFMGHSQGGITGPLAFAYEPDLHGAILSGAGGLIYWALLLKTQPIDIPGLLSTFVRDTPLDEFNNVLALVQMFIEPADPINYARLITREPPPGVPLRDVFQSQGFVDHYTPPPCIEAFGVALGGSPVGPLIEPLDGFDLAARRLLEPPVSRNLGERTVVFHQYPAAAGSDGHFVDFDDPDARRQSVEFLVTLVSDGVATLVP
jgi:predicted esterase